MKSKIVLTKDGSNTIFNTHFNEHYHSIHGAIQESMHVFVDSGFRLIKKSTISILEVGLGTGLNAFLTCVKNKDCKNILYTALEPYPIYSDAINQLGYVNNEEEKSIFFKIHNSKWGVYEKIAPKFNLKKISEKLETFQIKEKYDLIYFDAFSPSSQPELWNLEIFEKLYHFLNFDGLLVTYCSKGSFKRMLRETRFQVETLQGPPGKREITRAKKSK